MYLGIVVQVLRDRCEQREGIGIQGVEEEVVGALVVGTGGDTT